MSEANIEQYDHWLNDDGPVALIIKQHLASVDEDDPVIFPPTYPMNKWNGRVHTIRDGDYRVTVELPPDSKTDKSDSKNDQRPGYNIDRFPDGTNICEIDSPQSQSNRIEPKFKTIKDGKLVPQIEITVGSEKVNLLDVGHRAADAVVRMSSMAAEFHRGFMSAKSGNFFELAKYAPTSLVFGVWDSRSTHVKIQRALKAQIRATNVLELSRSAQYTPAVNYVDTGAIGEDTESGKKEEDNNLSQEGMKHALSTQTVGGVKLTGNSTLVRTVNLNLAAIRVIKGGTEEETKALQRYILGLALVAAMDEPDLNLREGCNLRYDNSEDAKPPRKLVYRNEPPEGQSCDFDEKLYAVQSFAEEVAKSFFEVANIESDRIDHPNVIFETGVAEAYLSRTKADRKKITRLGPITKNTMTSFDVQSKDPFKPVMELLKDVKRAIGRKPAKSKPRMKNVSAFEDVAQCLNEMAKNDILPDGVPELAGELAKLAEEHEDSHETSKMIEDRIKACKKALKEGSPVSSTENGPSESSE